MTSEIIDVLSSAEAESEMDTDECLLANTVYKANILDDVARSNAFFKSQQRGEKDLTFEEKREIAEGLMDKNNILFLQRYWKYINIRDISFFDDARANYEVSYYLEEIKKLHDKKRNQARIKNRRYEAMKKMVSEGTYFSEEEMKNRSPFLYEQLIGQYLTDDERSATKREEHKTISFSGFLMEQIDKNFVNHLSRMQENEYDAVEEENDDDDNIDDDDESELQDDDDEFRPANIPVRLPDSEKQMLKNEFTNIMYENFLSGKDTDFDYGSVDDNTEYDSVQEREIDEEEKYFDEDSSESLRNNAS